MGLQVNTGRPEGIVMTGQVLADVRVCRSADGALVADGDPRAAFLAYAIGDPVASAELGAYRELVDPAPVAKMATKPADKAAAKPGNK